MQTAGVNSFVATQPAQPAGLPALPAFPNLFAGRKLRQVILNPGDFLGLTTDSTKATPTTADADRLNKALGLQVSNVYELRQPTMECLARQDPGPSVPTTLYYRGSKSGEPCPDRRPRPKTRPRRSRRRC